MRIVGQIPNFITLLNLICGCLGIACAFNESLEYSAYLIGIAAVFDFLDGLVARLLKVQSEIGKQLDSLADMVTFGVLPGVILFQLITIGFKEHYVLLDQRNWTHILWSCSGFLVPVFSAIRLAKFNLDTRQTTSFIGLPTPACAIFVASLPVIIGVQYRLNLYYPVPPETLLYIAQHNHLTSLGVEIVKFISSPFCCIGLSIVLSLLLVSPLPMFSLKFKGIKPKKNGIRYVFLLLIVALVATNYFTGLWYIIIPITIILYLVMSIIHYLIKGSSV